MTHNTDHEHTWHVTRDQANTLAVRNIRSVHRHNEAAAD